MNSADRVPPEVELPPDHPRRVTVDDQLHFRRCLSIDSRGRDAIDRDDLDDLIEVDPYVSGTNSRRSDKDLARMLDLIDGLPISTNGKDGRQ